MSKTSIKERNKAIRLAWEREQILVAEGKGTTPSCVNRLIKKSKTL